MSGTLTWVLIDLAAAAAVLLMRRFLWMPLRVDGASMRPTFAGGEVVWAARIGLKRHGVRRGDIVICHYPGRTWKHCRRIRLMFIKRVIGLPGETISMVDGVTHINGEPIDEPWLDQRFGRSHRQMPERVIGADEVFVMGDNRMSSLDSRAIGPIKQGMLLARVVCVLWPVRK